MNTQVDKYSVVCAILSFVGFVIFKLAKKQNLKLEDLVMVIIAGGMLPVTLVIIIYPLWPCFAGSIEDMSLQISLMGLVLLYVYTKVIVKKIYHDSS